jgi:hypothetical protein
VETEGWSGRLAVFLATTVQPEDLTRFLRYKPTGEIALRSRGYGQFLIYDWRPDFQKRG